MRSLPPQRSVCTPGDRSSVLLATLRHALVFNGLQEEMSLTGYRKHLASQAAPLPLTAAEEELRQIKLNEVHACKQTRVMWVAFLGRLSASRVKWCRRKPHISTLALPLWKEH